MAITTAIAVAAVVAAGATAYSAHAAAEAAEYNADLAEQEAVQERQIAAVQEQNQRRKTRAVMAQQRAGFAASGVVPEGSPLELAEEALIDGELDALTVRWQGEAAARKAQAQGRLLRYQATTTRAAGYAQASASLIGGAARAGSSYNKLHPPKTDTGQTSGSAPGTGGT